MDLSMNSSTTRLDLIVRTSQPLSCTLTNVDKSDAEVLVRSVDLPAMHAYPLLRSMLNVPY